MRRLLFNYFSPSSRRLRGLIRSLDPHCLDAYQLRELRDELIARHADLPTGALWKIHDKAKPAAAMPTLTTPLAALLRDLQYSTERALANRNRAT